MLATRSSPALSDLFLSFLRLGLTAFGGPAMVAYIGSLSVERRKWLTQETFKAGVALCQSIPGATAIQTAGYVGLATRGIAGAFASYIGFGLPAFFFMLIFSSLYEASRALPGVASVFSGLQVIVVAIVANAVYTFGRTSIKRPIHGLLAVASAVALALHVSPFYVIIGAALAGIILFRRQGPPHSNTVQARPVFATTPILGLLAAITAGLVCLYVTNKGLFQLSLLMLKVDLFAFGGGFASIPLMLGEVVHVRGWMDAKTFMDGIALGQVTPGPIVITATFVGNLTHGLPGALVATLAIFTPSFMLLLLIAPLFEKLKGSRTFTAATQAILASFVGLLLYVTIKFALAVPWEPFRVCLAIASAVALFKKVDLIYIVLIGAALSLVLFLEMLKQGLMIGWLNLPAASSGVSEYIVMPGLISLPRTRYGGIQSLAIPGYRLSPV